jgi:hypothetical protein
MKKKTDDFKDRTDGKITLILIFKIKVGFM